MHKISLSFVIPTYNDEDTIADVITKAHSAGRAYCTSFEICVINDASTDTTPAILATLAKKYKELRVWSNTANKGYGQTIKELYYAGKKEWIFSLPGDDQIDPKELEHLIPATHSADMVIGKRKKRNDPLSRKIQSRVYNHLLRFLFGIPTFDVNSVRLMKKEILGNISLFATSAFVDAELVISAHRKNYTVVEIPIAHKERVTQGATGGKLLKTILPTVADMVHFYLQRLM